MDLGRPGVVANLSIPPHNFKLYANIIPTRILRETGETGETVIAVANLRTAGLLGKSPPPLGQSRHSEVMGAKMCRCTQHMTLNSPSAGIQSHSANLALWDRI